VSERFRPRSVAVVAGVVALLGAGCADVLLPPDPGDGPEEVARAAWEEIDAYYPWFALKGVDWDAVGREYLGRVGPDTGSGELFAVLSDMIDVLRDGHLALERPAALHSWEGWFLDYPVNFSPEAVAGYLQPPYGRSAGSAVSWATLRAGMGYLRIPSFGRQGVGEGVDAALAAMPEMASLVIDVRSNGGGSDTQAEAAAGRFLERSAVYRRVRYKAGPGHEDFGPELTSTVGPQGARRFTGPVAVLQNRGVFSAAEDFVLAMRTRANTTFVGDTTGGGSGNPIARELPNGWLLHVPRWRQVTADREIYEGVGLAPDLFASAPDTGLGEDRILERAVVFLVQTTTPSPPSSP
jgi:hypothetical protein